VVRRELFGFRLDPKPIPTKNRKMLKTSTVLQLNYLHSLVTEGDGSKTRWYRENFLAASVDGVDAQGVRSKWYATQRSHGIHSKKAIQAEKSNEINISLSYTFF
jgi:hypothetical protein